MNGRVKPFVIKRHVIHLGARQTAGHGRMPASIPEIAPIAEVGIVPRRALDAKGAQWPLESHCILQIYCRDPALNTTQEVLRILDETLSLGGRSTAFSRDTPLLGAIPELDSMAVVALITAMEEQLGIVVDDDDIDGATFATVGSLADFVDGKLAS